jgi:class 3 adenylate cyclase
MGPAAHPASTATAGSSSGARAPRPALQEEVCLILADLSGYTAYLAASEPDRAPAIVGDLVETIVRCLRPVARLDKLEGDAALMVAPLEGLTGDRLIVLLATTLAAFDRRLRSMVAATACTCAACSGIPTLDLKFVVHAGRVVRQRIAGRLELTGTDAIIAHRLLKADAPGRAGLQRYALFSEAAVSALALDPGGLGLVADVERFEHLGDIPVRLLDLASPEPTATRDRVGARRTLGEASLRVASSPDVLWEQLTDPGARSRWEGIDLIDEETPDGDRGAGTRTACIVDDLSLIEEIVTWEPSQRLVRRVRLPSGALLTAEFELEPEDAWTGLQARWYGSRRAADHVERERSKLERLAVSLGVPSDTTGGTENHGAHR